MWHLKRKIPQTFNILKYDALFFKYSFVRPICDIQIKDSLLSNDKKLGQTDKDYKS